MEQDQNTGVGLEYWSRIRILDQDQNTGLELEYCNWTEEKRVRYGGYVRIQNFGIQSCFYQIL